jgi:uncharacterized ferritin-like protein (DUF455 family)
VLPLEPPPPDTVERWAWDYIASVSLSHKLAPPPPPETWDDAAPPRRVDQPGRPPELHVATKPGKSPRDAALVEPLQRARLVHTFFHHELQAAELMCWAILAFPDAPRPFRSGLVGIARDEIRHMGLYARHLAVLGSSIGDFPIRDWFWRRVPSAASPIDFVATMGMGFEGGNLDHARRFEDLFRAASDVAGADMQAVVREEEILHVKFAVHWFRKLTDGVDFDAWRARLSPPLTPMVMRGNAINTRDRERAGLDATFLERLGAWNDASRGS